MRKIIWINILIIILTLAAAQAQPIELYVDVSEADRNIFHARLIIPVDPGPLTLYYPKWLPGYHEPYGPVNDLASLKIKANGETIAWQRDEVDMHTFYCQVPAGVNELEVSLDYLLEPETSTTTKLAILEWNNVLLYPAGKPANEILYQANLTMPAGWESGTALPVKSSSDQDVSYVAVSLETLVDSPVLCGKHFQQIPIGPAGNPQHYIEMAADSEAGLDLGPGLKANYDRLITEANALFGARHYNSYRFLVTLSDYVSHYGLEHHESSDNRLAERALINFDSHINRADLLPHELVHSWCGKYRRPIDMATSDFQQPKLTKLLWVYEGLTTYVAYVLAARCGLWTAEQFQANLALIAEWAQNQRGREWRPLDDTTVAAPILYPGRNDWDARRRGVDFYDEGALIWLEIDTIIRQQTQDSQSLDDFCRLFLGQQSGSPVVNPFTFDDVIADLNAIAPYDWKSFLQKRVTAIEPQAPLNGITQSGWRLIYEDSASEFQKIQDAAREETNLTASIGLSIEKEGLIEDIIPGKAADRAGIGPGMKLVAANWRRWSPEIMREAVAATQTDPLELLLENGEFFKTYTLDYHDGLKYPRLERDQAKEDLLTKIIEPLTPVEKK